MKYAGLFPILFSADLLINFCTIKNHSSLLQMNTLKPAIRVDGSNGSETSGRFYALKECERKDVNNHTLPFTTRQSASAW